MEYLSRLSGTQRGWLVGTLAASVAIVAVGWALEPKGPRPLPPLTTEMSISDIAPELDVTGKALARDLGLPLDAPKTRPLGELGIAQEDLERVAAHLLGDQFGPVKYYVFAAIVLWGLVFLVRLGRPDGSPQSERKTWYPRGPYVAALLVAVVVCGFVLGKSPNPMEGAVKVFKSMVGLYASVGVHLAALAFFLALAVVGNKLVCGWACPFGALQELLYSLPLLKRIKRRMIPFVAANAIRATIFAAMLLLIFGVVGGRKGLVLYHFVNPFNLFNLSLGGASVAATIVVALGLGLAVYRPYCQFICPFGFVSWLAERLSLARVRVDLDRCNQCGACVRACPVEAAKHKVAGKLFAADCFSCARCLNVCPQQAIDYDWVLKSRPPGRADDQ